VRQSRAPWWAIAGVVCPKSVRKTHCFCAAGRLAGEILDALAERIQPGTTTAEIDKVVEEMTYSRGAKSAGMSQALVSGKSSSRGR